VFNLLFLAIVAALVGRRIAARLSPPTRTPHQVIRADHFRELAASGAWADVVMLRDSLAAR